MENYESIKGGSMEGEIIGYKAFQKGLINSYGVRFQVGKKYHINGPIVFGTTGNGFHFCKRIEDTLRYVEGFQEFDICMVIGSGTITEFCDEYYGYYDMYASSDLILLKKLSREEIFEIAYQMNPISLDRFLRNFPLTKEEIISFQNYVRFQPLLQKTIAYYQLGDKDAYKRS